VHLWGILSPFQALVVKCAHSEEFRPGIPTETGHHSDRRRPLIPVDSGHFSALLNLRYILLAPPPSDLHRLPPPHNPYIPMDLLEFLRILRVYWDQNIGIDRLNRILEVALAGVA